MDLFTLSINLEKEPNSYVEEFKKQVQAYSNICKLPKQPSKTLRQTLDLLVKFSFLDKEGVSYETLRSLEYLKSYKLKKVVLSAILSLTYKKLISPSICIKSILENSADPLFYINKVKSFINEDCTGLIKEYWNIGDDKQKAFSYYLLLFLFSKYNNKSLLKEICDGLFLEGKIKKMSFSYFLENFKSLDTSCKPYGRRLWEEINSKVEEREIKIMKMRVYVLFKEWCGLKPSIVPLALSMIDCSKEDVKDLMNVIVDSVTEKEVESVLKTIGIHFCSPFKEEDLICYGLNLFRGIYAKFENGDEKDGECEEGGMDSSSSNMDSNDEDGSSSRDSNGNVDNMDRNRTYTPTYNTPLKDLILNYADCFKDSKTKSISYSYRALINIVKHKKDTAREIGFIFKRLSKEERLEMHKNNKEENKTNRELYKAEKKEISKKKSKRKFKLSKKRLKINANKRK